MNPKKLIGIVVCFILVITALGGCSNVAGTVAVITPVTTQTLTETATHVVTLTTTSVSTQTAIQTTTQITTSTITPVIPPVTEVVVEPVKSEAEIVRPDGWTEITHSNKAAPDYHVVFPQDKVNQITIKIAPDDWAAMQADMIALFGLGGRTQPQVPGIGGMLPGFNPMLPGGGIGDLTPENPVWVSATIEFNGFIWTKVGVRYKGNSSLTSGWRSGTLKLPLKLDFDEFEDDYPEIKNQRFYGFKQLSLSNSFSDGSFMRDAISAHLFEAAGIAAAKTAYYEVVLDYGEDPVNLGLYVMIEVIDDTVIDRVFGGDSGNIYEGDGTGVSLAAGTTIDRIENSFKKENNIGSDWSDIIGLYDVLHASNRSVDPETWRKDLDAVFNVDVFLEWLAISAVIQNWDTYGSMYHNFYLYNNSETGQLTWIPWDHNMVFGVGGGVNPRAGAPVGRGTVSFDKQEIGQNWPLIRFLLDDPVYYTLYLDYLAQFIEEIFIPENLETECRALAALLTPYIEDSDKITFTSAVNTLIKNIQTRYQAAVSFLSAAR